MFTNENFARFHRGAIMKWDWNWVLDASVAPSPSVSERNGYELTQTALNDILGV